MKITSTLFLLFIFTGLVYSSEIQPKMLAFHADKSALQRKYNNPLSEEYFQRIALLYSDGLRELSEVDYASLSIDGQTDFQLFKNQLEKQAYFHNQSHREFQEVAQVLSFANELITFYQQRRSATKPDASRVAAQFQDAINTLQMQWEIQKESTPYPSWQQAGLAAQVIERLNRSLKEAYDFYYDFDPNFSWWVQTPWTQLNKNLKAYEDFLKDNYENTVTTDDGSGILGRPIGKIALEKELNFEMIAYSPEELIKEAEKQYAWCEKEMIKASQELGFGNDWHEAMEYVKNQYAAPGDWPEIISGMAVEAIDFLEKNDLITIPDLAKETWRTNMLSAEAQKFSPFFLGGESILIAYPTSTMTHEEKMMSMRGNNRHFARAVVQHELIPGHHLQQFMNQRHHPHRRAYGTAFWTEGWALYWEFTLWDKNFPKSAEDRVGMLFWRMHRAARIIFSLNYHLGKMTPQECIDFLVDKVGHERANAEAEVRRSFTGGYGPLYQIAYMVGGLQLTALKKEMALTGAMSEKEFHDFIITQNNMPIELLRARIKNKPIAEDFQSTWRFLD